MSKCYSPGPEADEIIARQLARGGFGSAEEVVRAGVKMLDERGPLTLALTRRARLDLIAIHAYIADASSTETATSFATRIA